MQEQEQTDEQPVTAKRISELTADELRDYNAASQRRSRGKKRTKAEEKFRKPDCKDEPSKKDAKDILAERGIRNSHVIDVLTDLTETAARQHKIVFNDHLLRHGLRATIAALDGQDFEDPENGEVPGELISRLELYALWDVSASDSMSFEEFVTKRHRCKTDCFFLGKEILGKDFHEPHKAWSDFFPKFNPDALKPDYTQEDMKQWLDSQTAKKDFLLLASRNCYKSSFSHVWLVSAILNCPDLRCLLISETQPLAKGFIRAVRGYFEIGSQAPRRRTLHRSTDCIFTIQHTERDRP